MKKNSSPKENTIDHYNNIFIESLKQFSFGNNLDKIKTKELYETLNHNKLLISLGSEQRENKNCNNLEIINYN